MSNNRNSLLRLLPSVNELVAEIAQSEGAKEYDLPAMTWAVRRVLEKARNQMLEQELEPAEDIVLDLTYWLKREIFKELKGSGSLKRVINATGVILHTNCGRALLAPEAAAFVAEQATCYSNLELDIETGSRGSRYHHVDDILTELTGAEASLVVNNNAAAVLLIMNTFADQKEVIVSRGELVEIGGSFRIPEVLKAGGARLIEVGTTNKTWLHDYREAISAETAMMLKVHPSNFRIEGFHHAVSTAELVGLGDELGIPVVEDLGSGSFFAGTDYGLPAEPTIQETVKSGVSLLCFSGDKLLGGPQAGIILGKKELIEKLKKNQLTRALRVDKLVIAALIGTLRLYQKGQIEKIPVWNMISRTREELARDAHRLAALLSDISDLEVRVQEDESCIGGGAFPTAALFSVVCAVKPKSRPVDSLEKFMRQADIPILARIAKDWLILDPRTLLPEDYTIISERMHAIDL
ncbi:L-seryl-tRNA(Sec) selenium transferase [Dehalobacter sp. DCM]|uniref:L-seryl-tRNA(Sec) selenium transferase n=1 Tax=Dehalobacter sp. DCM TaxID=2907827 RepID=UPI0030813912|nr:L-seryl-tRNA(Sec) selenium transferase [Dehalobacter sp. DCM]